MKKLFLAFILGVCYFQVFGQLAPPTSTHFGLNGNSFVRVADHGNLDLSGQRFTIESWIYTCSNQTQSIVSKRRCQDDGGWSLLLRNVNGQLRLAFNFETNIAGQQCGDSNNNGIFALEVQTQAPINLNAWTHVAVVCNNNVEIQSNATNIDGITLFINGVQQFNLISQRVISVPSGALAPIAPTGGLREFGITNSSAPMYIGAYLSSNGGANLGQLNPTPLFRGYMDELRIWNESFFELQVARAMNGNNPITGATGINGSTQNLLAWYRFLDNAIHQNSSNAATYIGTPFGIDAGDHRQLSINVPNSPICTGSPISLTATTGFQTYNWNSSNGSAQGNPYIFTPTSATQTIVGVTATALNGCISSSSTTLYPLKSPSLNLSAINGICDGTTTNLTSSASGGVPPYTYQWSNGQTATNLIVPSGTYQLTITDVNGCTASSLRTIGAYRNPTVTISGNPWICSRSTNLTANSVGGSIPHSYVWSNGLGTSQSVNIGYQGLYSVTATSQHGCTGTQSVFVGLATNNTGFTHTTCRRGNLLDIDFQATTAAGTNNGWYLYPAISCTGGVGDNNMVNPASPLRTFMGADAGSFDDLNFGCYIIKHGRTINGCWFESRQLVKPKQSRLDASFTRAASSTAGFDIATPDDQSAGNTHYWQIQQYINGVWTAGLTTFSTTPPYTFQYPVPSISTRVRHWVVANTGCNYSTPHLYEYNEDLRQGIYSTSIYSEAEPIEVGNTEETVLSGNPSIGGASAPVITLFPNPTTGLITIQHPMEAKQLAIYDMMGKLVSQTKVEGSSQTEIDLSSMPNGIYFLRMDGYATQKIAKQD